jgi:hypothetical protein
MSKAREARSEAVKESRPQSPRDTPDRGFGKAGLGCADSPS